MGHSQADKALTHRRIVEIAARRFREKGLDGIGVADLMKEAGLTVGGFYKHFASREALVAEAVAAGGKWSEQANAAKSGGPPLDLNQMIDTYLSPGHRDNGGVGCVFGAIGPDIARSGEETRAIATAQLEANIEMLAGLLAQRDAAAGRAQAILAFSAMVGAIALARVAKGSDLSQEILDRVAAQLKAP